MAEEYNFEGYGNPRMLNALDPRYITRMLEDFRDEQRRKGGLLKKLGIVVGRIIRKALPRHYNKSHPLHELEANQKLEE